MLRLKAVLLPLFLHGLVVGIIPWWIAGGFHIPEGPLGLVAIPGTLLGIGGAALIFWTSLLFADVGRGTLLIFDPPKKFVVQGPFRWIRHPIYAGALLIAFGETLATLSLRLLIYTACLAAAAHLNVVFVEEPVLRKRFGDLYDVYCAKVPRWIPRLRKGKAVEET